MLRRQLEHHLHRRPAADRFAIGSSSGRRHLDGGRHEDEFRPFRGDRSARGSSKDNAPFESGGPLMPRHLSKNVFQIAFRIPEEWLPRFDALLGRLAPPGGNITRTDAMRIALLRGLESMEDEFL